MANPYTIDIGDEFLCLKCGEYCEAEKEYHQFGMCSECANITANLYSHAHSGRFLTWANPTDKPAFSKQPIPESIRWTVFERDDYTCKHCGSHFYLRVDHIVPESKGGTMDLDNLQTLCNTCNCKKGAR